VNPPITVCEKGEHKMTTRPKGKLFALLAVFVAIGLVTASGAFTSVTAERTATVTTAGDENANFLQFETNDADITGLSSGASGSELGFDVSNVNLNASTDFGVEFNVTYPASNSGSIYFYIADEDSERHAAVTQSATIGTDALEFEESSSSIEGQNDRTTMSSGDTIIISLSIDTTGTSINQLDNEGTILFVANSTA